MATKTNNVTKKSTGGLLGGLILLVIGIGILWSNEGRTVKNQSGINEALKNVIEVKSAKIDSKNEGKLIATTGKIDLGSSEELTDSTFGIKVKAAKLERIVEVYQWVENCETDENDKETCTYNKEWKDDLVDSTDFKKSGYTNPTSLAYQPQVYSASNIHVGAFELPERLLTSLSFDKELYNEQLKDLYKNNIEGYKVNGDYITNMVNIDDPQIGDTRISYKYASDGEVSLIGVQDGNTLKAYKAKKGKTIFEIRRGSYTAREIFDKMTSSNKTMKWLLRFLGIFLVISSIGSIFAPLQKLTSKVPILSNLVNMSTSLISTVVGLAISFIVIAIAWFRFRPVLSIVLLGVAVCLIIFLKMKNNENVDDNKTN